MRNILMSAAAGGLFLFVAGVAINPIYPPALLDLFDPRRIGAECNPPRPMGTLRYDLLVATAAASPASAAKPMPLYPDLTKSAFVLTTTDESARNYFNQGLTLTYGFSHASAVRSFREAQKRDPNCALCFWGEAFALGPNINAPMDRRDDAAALAALERAMALRHLASPPENALIEALSLRYARDPTADRAALDLAYAEAMIAVAARFPKDDDIAVLAAEAAMDTSPWNYWAPDKKTPLNSRVETAIRLIEGVLARNPSQSQAAHLYIHLIEASDPARAEAAADRLRESRPASAGHLVHMPGHIYFSRGRYADAIRVNTDAVRADEAFIRATDDRSLVRYGYYPHNIHFIVASAQMAGDMRTALAEARRLRTVLDVETSSSIAWIQAIDAAPYLAMAQFGAPKAILAMPAPDARLPYATGMRHYARAVAYAQLRDTTGFETELRAMEALQTSGALAGMIAQGVPADDLMTLASHVARARLAASKNRYQEAVAHYRAAIKIEDALAYQEPPFWYFPVRQSLGAALFLDREYAEASLAFREAILRTPNNGWALYGLMISESAQGHTLEVAAARNAFRQAWRGDKRWLRLERL